MSPEISVIVPTHNRREMLANLLAGLAAQNFDAERWELIVVNDGSTDGTHGLLEESAQSWPTAFTQVRGKHRNTAAVRNAGAHHASGRVLLFLDDDMTVSPDLLQAHGQAHAEPGVAAIGQITAPPSRRDAWTAWDDAQLAKLAASLADGTRAPGPRDYYGGNCSVDASLFRQVGGYNIDIERAEDLDLGYRLAAAGALFIYCVDAISVHHGAHRFRSWLRNATAFGRSEVTLAREFGHGSDFAAWYRDRHSLNRALIRMCSVFPVLRAPAIAALDVAGRAAHAAGGRQVADMAYSAIYNLAYWRGLIGEFGTERFWQEADQVPATGSLPSLP